MNATQTHIKVYNVSPHEGEDFEFDYDVTTSDLLTELVPDLDDWGGIGWMELEEYEYDPHHQTLHLVLETKSAPPTEWLRNASLGAHCFENKLITMAAIRNDEALVTGSAIRDGVVLQSRRLFEMDPHEIKKYYNDDEPAYDLNKLDNQIWESIGQFTSICTGFYLSEDTAEDCADS